MKFRNYVRNNNNNNNNSNFKTNNFKGEKKLPKNCKRFTNTADRKRFFVILREDRHNCPLIKSICLNPQETQGIFECTPLKDGDFFAEIISKEGNTKITFFPRVHGECAFTLPWDEVAFCYVPPRIENILLGLGIKVRFCERSYFSSDPEDYKAEVRLWNWLMANLTTDLA